MGSQTPIAAADRAIASMRSPRDMHIICVDVTNKCDLKCSNCTRLLANQTKLWDMTPDNFRLALRSLKNFKGVIAMIGGNPCMHPQFDELCRIFVEEVPEPRQRGLWSNNVFKHQELIKDTFGFFNLNPHGDERGTKSLEKLKQLMPQIEYYKGNSHHAPLLTAMRDLYPDEEAMWAQIATCDINREWSATLIQNKGELRAYFCEVAASFDLARGEDHGIAVTEDWWDRSIADFSDQVERFCPGCGVPARLEGLLDADETDCFTKSNADIANPKGRRRARKTVEIEAPDAVASGGRHVTDYNEAHLRGAGAAPAPASLAPVELSPMISVVIPFYNSNDTLRDTVLSVTSQAGVPCEVIIVDDCSSQDPRAALEGVEGRIRIFRNVENRGPAYSRNAGLLRAAGRFVCFLDSDDQYTPGFFAEAMRFFAAQPEVMALTTGVELINCHRHVTQYHHGCLTNSIPSNVMVRTDAARLLGGFPEDPAFRGPAAGEDVCFKGALSHLVTHHASFPFLRYRVRSGSHFDRFLDNLQLRDGHLVPISPSPQEQDGSLIRAIQTHHAKVAARLITESEVAARGYPLGYSSFHLGEDYEGVKAQCDGAEGGIAPEEGYALAHWTANGPGQGGVVELGCGQNPATLWLAAGCRDSRRGKLVAIDPFLQNDAGVQRHLDLLQARMLGGAVDTVRALSPAVAKQWENQIRLLVIGGGASFMVAEQDLTDWSRHVEPMGAYAFHGVGVRPAVTRLYEAISAQTNVLREVFSLGSLRILAAR